jgi:hypothetical protein
MRAKHRSFIAVAAVAGVLGLAGTAAATPPACKRICCEFTCEFDAKCTWGGIVTTCSEFPQWCDDACPFAYLDEDVDLSSELIEPVSRPDEGVLGAEAIGGWIASLQ